MKKESKITEITTFIESTNKRSSEKISTIQNEPDQQLHCYTQYNNLIDDQEIFHNLQMLFPDKNSDEIKYAIKCCDTFDAMINMLTSSETVTLMPHIVKEDLCQRVIPRSIDYDLVYMLEKDKEANSALEVTVFEHNPEQKEIDHSGNAHPLQLANKTLQNINLSCNSVRRSLFQGQPIYFDKSTYCNGSKYKNTVHINQYSMYNNRKIDHISKYSVYNNKKTDRKSDYLEYLNKNEIYNNKFMYENKKTLFSQKKIQSRTSIHYYSYKYPEIFGKDPRDIAVLLKKHGLIGLSNPIGYLREQAYSKSREQKRALSHMRNNNHLYNSYYSDKSASLLAARDSLNYLAVLLILNRNSITRDFIDLHGLHVSEIENVLTDWLNWRSATPNHMHVVTYNHTGVYGSAQTRDNKNISKFSQNKKNKRNTSDMQKYQTMVLDRISAYHPTGQQLQLKPSHHTRLVICTGTARKAHNIRPRVLQFFKQRKCGISEEGPSVIIEFTE